MKKISIFIILLIIILFSLYGCSNNSNNNTYTSENIANTSVDKIGSELELNNIPPNSNNSPNNTVTEIVKGAHDSEDTYEEEIANFSTKLSGSDSPRSRNIRLTCSFLNGSIVNPSETFSFCGTIGNPTQERGYEQADSFDKNGNKVKTFGGGNCQVSSTLYNAVLQVPELLEVKERHAHIKRVYYVPKDKDATVAYGSVDFKFKNNTDSKIKIYASSELQDVVIKLVKIP